MKTDLKTENCFHDFSGLGVGAALPCPWGFDWGWGLVPYRGCTCRGPTMLAVLLCPLPPAKTFGTKELGGGDSSKPSCQ